MTKPSLKLSVYRFIFDIFIWLDAKISMFQVRHKNFLRNLCTKIIGKVQNFVVRYYWIFYEKKMLQITDEYGEQDFGVPNVTYQDFFGKVKQLELIAKWLQREYDQSKKQIIAKKPFWK